MTATASAQAREWLSNQWRAGGQAIAVLEGFAGVGKTTVAREFLKYWPDKKVYVTASQGTLFEEFLLEVASSLEVAGLKTMADAEDWEKALEVLLVSGGLLLVVDDFETQLQADGFVSASGLQRFLTRVSRRSTQGRVLLVSTRSPAADEWMSNSAVRTMAAPSDAEGTALLQQLLHDRNLQGEVPPDQVADVARWLGNNPRAMRAFVSCLLTEAFDEIIDVDRESWELRSEGTSRELVERLETEFWSKTIGALDAESIALAENLSVFRKPFRNDAIGAVGATNRNWESARNTLLSSFALERNNPFFSLNPIVRQLSIRSLARQEPRAVAAHARAADYFSRRLSADGVRAIMRAGAAFLEARHHLVRAGKNSELEAISGDFRRAILPAFRTIKAHEIDVNSVHAVAPILLSALPLEDTGSYQQLRGELVILLIRRGRPGDDRLAMRHARIAATGRVRQLFWRYYVDLAARVETDLFLRELAAQAMKNCPDSPEAICSKIAEVLVTRENSDFALHVVDEALTKIGNASAKVHLISVKAYVLDRAGRSREALYLLRQNYASLRDASPVAYRLFEEACFLAFQLGSANELEQLRSLATQGDTSVRAQDRATLAEVLQRQLLNDHEGVEQVGSSALRYPAVACQVAFARMAKGDPVGARELAPKFGGVANQSNDWLFAIVALALEDADTYWESMARATGQVLTPEELADSHLWLRVWDSVPQEHRPYPSYYFPRLPMSLTGLPHDLERRASGGSQAGIFLAAEPQLPRVRRLSPLPTVSAAPEVVERDGALTVIINNSNSNMNEVEMASDTYNNYGQAGAMGPGAHIRGGVHQAHGVQVPELVDALRALRSFAAEAGDEMVEEQLGVALEAVESGDASKARRLLGLIAAWIGDKTTDLAVGVAAATVVSALGL